MRETKKSLIGENTSLREDNARLRWSLAQQVQARQELKDRIESLKKTLEDLASVSSETVTALLEQKASLHADFAQQLAHEQELHDVEARAVDRCFKLVTNKLAQVAAGVIE